MQVTVRWRLYPAVYLALAAMLIVAGCVPGSGLPGLSRSAAPTSVQDKPNELLRLRLGLGSTPAPALPNSVLWLAADLGYYQREGLEVELLEVQGTPSVITALRTGDVDVGNVGTEDVLKLAATQTLDLRAIHSPDASLYFLIAARDTVGTVQELKGKKLGIARVGSVDHTLTERVLKARGLAPGDVEWVAIGAPAVRAQALAGGRIDATAMSIATWASTQHEKGLKVLVDSSDYFAAAPIVQKVDAVTARTLQEKPEHLRRFTAAIMKASRHFAESRPEWVEAMVRRRSDLNRQDLEELWGQFNTSWAVNGSMSPVQYGETAEFLYGTDDFKDVPRIELRDWTEPRFVEAVLQEIGVHDKPESSQR